MGSCKTLQNAQPFLCPLTINCRFKVFKLRRNKLKKKSWLYKTSWDTFSVGREPLKESRGKLKKWLQKDKLRGWKELRKEAGRRSDRRDGGGEVREYSREEVNQWREEGRRDQSSHKGDDRSMWNAGLWLAESPSLTGCLWSAHICDHIFHTWTPLIPVRGWFCLCTIQIYYVWWKRQPLFIVFVVWWHIYCSTTEKTKTDQTIFIRQK